MKTIAVLIFTFCLMACERDGTEIDNPGIVDQGVTINFSSFSGVSSASALRKGENDLNPFSVQSVTMCFKRLRFKRVEIEGDDSEDFEEDVDIDVGRVTLDPSGGELTKVVVPEGTYDQIEFDIEKDCLGEGSPAVIVDNDNDGGTPFQTDEGLTIKFSGLRTIDAETVLELSIVEMIAALDTVTEASQIKDKLEDVSSEGEF